jgi:hypothetical protein
MSLRIGKKAFLCDAGSTLMFNACWKRRFAFIDSASRSCPRDFLFRSINSLAPSLITVRFQISGRRSVMEFKLSLARIVHNVRNWGFSPPCLDHERSLKDWFGDLSRYCRPARLARNSVTQAEDRSIDSVRSTDERDPRLGRPLVGKPMAPWSVARS